MAFEAHKGELAVIQPGDVVARPDVHVPRIELGIDVAGDRLRLRDLLRLEAAAFEHVLEVHVAADVQLVGAVQHETALFEQAGEHAVRDGGPELALDVVPDDRQPRIGELLRPHRIARNEDWQCVDKGDTRIKRSLGVELRALLRANRQIADQHLRARVAQGLRHVDDRQSRLLDQLAVILAEPVERRTALYKDSGCRDLGESESVVLAGPHRLGKIETHLCRIHVEGRDEGDVTDRVATETRVHQSRNDFGLVGFGVERDSLDEGIGAVSDTGDGNFQGHARRAP